MTDSNTALPADASAGWTQALRDELAAAQANGRVGSRLVSTSERVRVWTLVLQPGERIGFHKHVLDYFWTAVTPGRAQSRYADGRIVNVTYEAGDTQHHHYKQGDFMIHDLSNIGDTTLMFTTVEFLDSANKPLSVETA
jgi:beta-alanine degradation protein BauB